MKSQTHPGAWLELGGTRFVVVTTTAREVGVRLFDAPGNGRETRPLERMPGSDPPRFEALLDGVLAGALYKLVLDGDEVPDPYARSLPFGVHGPARVTAPTKGTRLAGPLPLHRLSIYELHVGTFTEAGTYAAAAGRLGHLVELGVTAIELLPIAAFDGKRGWGYDGVALYAPYVPYGDITELQAFLAAAHARGLAVILDAVYNHFGPSGNYLSKFAPEYFTSKIQTPWGPAPDFTWAPMRALAIENARYWLDEVGFDGLRLDATHEIHDPSTRHVLCEITDLAHERGCVVFFESDRNDPGVVTELGADGMWADDFHHQVHVLLTGERDGYYGAYEPTVEALATCIREGWTFTGQPYSGWKGRARGKPRGTVAHEALIACIQNHDQIGNRAFGTRLTVEAGGDAFRAAAVLLLFLPTTPLLFMGQEWGASTPFLYFSDYEGELGEAVSRGRREEFKAFAAFQDPVGRAEIPDPQAPATFEASRLRWSEATEAPHARVLEIHRTMLRLRQSDPVLSSPGGGAELTVNVDGRVLEVVRRNAHGARRLLVNFGDAPAPLRTPANEEVIVATLPVADGALPARAAVLLGTV